MKQVRTTAGGGPDFDWPQDHVFVTVPPEVTDGRVTVVEYTHKPGSCWRITTGR